MPLLPISSILRNNDKFDGTPRRRSQNEKRGSPFEESRYSKKHAKFGLKWDGSKKNENG